MGEAVPESSIRLDFVAAGPSSPGPSSPGPGDQLSTDDLASLYAHPEAESGWVRANFVSTVDGAAAGDDGRSGSINTPSDQRVFAVLRALSDVVLVGAGTVRAEGYRAIDLAPWQVQLRRRLGRSPVPLLAIVTAGLDVDVSVAPRSADEGPVLILTSERSDAEARERLVRAGVSVQTFPGSRVDLPSAVGALVQRGATRVLCEGGAGLLHGLFAADLVDELCLTLSARVVAGDAGRIVTGESLRPNRRLELAHLLHADDGALFTRYLLSRDRGSASGRS